MQNAHGTQSPSSAVSAVTPLCASIGNTSGKHMNIDENDRISLGSRTRPKMTRGQLRYAKNSHACVRCGKYGHWYGDHESNGKIDRQNLAADEPRHEPSHTLPVASDKQSNNRKLSRSEKTTTAVSFYMTTTKALTMEPDSHAIFTTVAGPMGDNGALY